MLDTQCKKIWADLCTRKGRTVLTLVGLFVGLWGIGTVTIAWSILSVDLAQNFDRTNPPNIVMALSQPAPENLFETAPDYLVTENRPVIAARLRVSENGWLPMYLFVVEDFDNLKLAQFFPAQGAWPPPEGSLLIERSSQALLGFYRAQVPTAPAEGVADIRLLRGGSVSTRIAGTVYDPGQAPSTMERVIYGYISADTAAQWSGKTANARILSRVESASQAAPAVSYLQDVIEANGLELKSTTLRPTPEHPHQFQMNSILFLLSGLGLLALLMSMVLAINLISSLLSNQIRQIGTLKAIGASSTRIACLYLATMLVLGLSASLLVLPLVIESGFGLAGAISSMLNFDILSSELPLSLYIFLVLFGALLPVAAAWYPVRKWSAVSVRDALDNFGVDNREFSPLLHALSSPLPHSVRLGVRNALRQPRRLALTVFILCIGILSFLLATGMRASLQQTAAAEEAMHRYQISVNFAQPVKQDQINWLYNADGTRDLGDRKVTAIELWQTNRIKLLSDSGEVSDPYSVLGVPDDSQALVPNMMAGSWLSREQVSGIVVNNRFAAKHPQLSPGASYPFSINGKKISLKLLGIVKEFNTASVFIRGPMLRQLTQSEPDSGNLVLITLDNADFRQQAQFRRGLERELDSAGLTGRQVQTATIASQIITSHLDMIVVLLAFVALVMLFVSGLGVASGVGTSIIERTRELGSLRAMGATPAAIRGILLSESLFMTVVAWVLALVLSPVVGQYLSAYFGAGIVEYPFDYTVSLSGIYLSLAAVALVVLVATLLPAHVATSGEISAAVEYD